MGNVATTSKVNLNNTDGIVSASAADSENDPHAFEQKIIQVVPIDFFSTQSVTTSFTSLYNAPSNFDMYVTEISVLPFNLNATLSFSLQYGGYNIGSYQNNVQITNASFRRQFIGNRLPRLYMGDILNFSASSTVAQSVTIQISGYRV